MPNVHLLRGSAVALATAALFGCASKPAEPPMVMTSATSSSTATSTTTSISPLSRAQIAAIVASPDRSQADRTNDQRRHPEDILMFIGAKPGWTALDVSTGGGYTTELLARVIGPTGMVWAQSQPRGPMAAPKPAAPENGGPAPVGMPAAQRTTADVLAARAAAMKTAGVPAAPIAYAALKFDNPVPPEVADGKLDLVTLMFNYHDFGFLGVDRAQANAAIYKALKPGGFYVIADHAGRAHTGIQESGTLHRIEESFLRAEVEAAGFRLVAEGDFLRNANDPRNLNTPNPPQPKDEFVLKFVKP